LSFRANVFLPILCFLPFFLTFLHLCNAF